MLDVVRSPSSSYLLPDLVDFSLVKREAKPQGFGRMLICDGSVLIDKPSTDDEAVGIESLLGLEGRAAAPLKAFYCTTDPRHRRSEGELSRVLSLAIDYLRTATLGPFTSKVPAKRRWVGHPNPASLQGARQSVVESLDRAIAMDAPVADIASRVAALANVGDQKLADLFKVERETFCRWRTGALANPRPANRRRLGLLLRLLDDLDERGVNIRDWLLNSVTADGDTPYQLLTQGRFDAVAYVASTVGKSPVARDPRIATRRELEPLQFGDDDVWEPQDDEDE